jgi:hypothetical protein
MKPKYKRTRLWVDPAFQAGLLLRMGFYFFLYVVSVLHIGFCFHVINELGEHGPRGGLWPIYLEFVQQQKPLLIALVVTIPLVYYDLLKFSNRIAGPLFRCRRVMQEMASGKAVPPFEPRKRDFMRELFQAFNALITAWNARVGANQGANLPLAERDTAEVRRAPKAIGRAERN